VLNELDALVNVDLDQRVPRKDHKSLNLVRIGTSGSLQADINVDTPVAAKMGIGFDGLLNFYAKRNEVCNLEAEAGFKKHTSWNGLLASPYFIEGSKMLLDKVAFDMIQGLTISAPGFYGPQGREIRLDIQDKNINQKLPEFSYNGTSITNYEMECSAIYGLSALLGHNALTICSIIANRAQKAYSKDYKVAVKELIKVVLERLCA
jgi:uridine phosphorylase